MPQDPATPATKVSRRSFDKKPLGTWLSNSTNAKSFRRIFTARKTKHFKDLASHPTHFNQLHHMTMRELLIRTDCGPSDEEVRELLSYLAEFGVIEFKDDIVSVPADS